MSKDRFTVIYSSSDYTKQMSDFLGRDISLSITAGNYLYVGLYKPFNSMYIKLEGANALESNVNIERNTRNGWSSVESITDDTIGMTQSGLITWIEDDNNTDSIETVVQGEQKFFYRVSWDDDITVTLRAIGVLFSDDNDIFLESPILDNERYRKRVVGSDSDYTRVHLQVRDYMLQEIRNNGIKKYNSENNDERLRYFRKITEFDLFDLEEVKLACRMLAMSNIYYKLSDEVDDKWKQEGDRYRQEYYRALDIAFISIDINDDGELDGFENMRPIKNIRITR